MRRSILAVAIAFVVVAPCTALAGDTVTKGYSPPAKTSAKLPPGKPSGGPHRQPVDPNPSKGGNYGGDSAGGSGGGGYIGDPNAPGHKQF
jgi:hypothetical protein